MEDQIARLYRACELDPENELLEERLKALLFRTNRNDSAMFVFAGKIKEVERKDGDVMFSRKFEDLEIFIVKTGKHAYILGTNFKKTIRWARENNLSRFNIFKSDFYGFRFFSEYGHGDCDFPRKMFPKNWDLDDGITPKVKKILKKYTSRRDHQRIEVRPGTRESLKDRWYYKYTVKNKKHYKTFTSWGSAASELIRCYGDKDKHRYLAFAAANFQFQYILGNSFFGERYKCKVAAEIPLKVADDIIGR